MVFNISCNSEVETKWESDKTLLVSFKVPSSESGFSVYSGRRINLSGHPAITIVVFGGGYNEQLDSYLSGADYARKFFNEKQMIGDQQPKRQEYLKALLASGRLIPNHQLTTDCPGG